MKTFKHYVVSLINKVMMDQSVLLKKILKVSSIFTTYSCMQRLDFSNDCEIRFSLGKIKKKKNSPCFCIRSCFQKYPNHCILLSLGISESNNLCVMSISIRLPGNWCPCGIIWKIKCIYKFTGNIPHLETQVFC